MATIKAILWSRANSDGTKTIKIRITEDRKSRYLNVGFSIQEKDWNPRKSEVRSSNPFHKVINQRIQQLILEAHQACLAVERQPGTTSADKISFTLLLQIFQILKFSWKYLKKVLMNVSVLVNLLYHRISILLT